jgi:hypothetical protein
VFLQEKVMNREKKVGKQFQYDMPSDLLMTFLSEVSAISLTPLIQMSRNAAWSCWLMDI